MAVRTSFPSKIRQSANGPLFVMLQSASIAAIRVKRTWALGKLAHRVRLPQATFPDADTQN